MSFVVGIPDLFACWAGASGTAHSSEELARQTRYQVRLAVIMISHTMDMTSHKMTNAWNFWNSRKEVTMVTAIVTPIPHTTHNMSECH